MPAAGGKGSRDNRGATCRALGEHGAEEGGHKSLQTAGARLHRSQEGGHAPLLGGILLRDSTKGKRGFWE